MGVGGMDIAPISDRARKVFPYSIECKIRKQLPSLLSMSDWKELDKWMAQAADNSDGLIPIVVFRANRSDTFVVIEKSFAPINAKYEMACFGPSDMIIRLDDFLESLHED
jgi:hypothetical protein